MNVNKQNLKSKEREDKDQIENNISNIISLQQSETQRLKAMGSNNLFKYLTKYKSTCRLCHRDDVWIVKKKEEICAWCYSWCKRWIIKKYSIYDKTKLYEAMAIFLQPTKCRFYSTCGSTVERFDDNGVIKKNSGGICSKCLPIFRAGYNLGLSLKKRHQISGSINAKREY